MTKTKTRLGAPIGAPANWDELRPSEKIARIERSTGQRVDPWMAALLGADEDGTMTPPTHNCIAVISGAESGWLPRAEAMSWLERYAADRERPLIRRPDLDTPLAPDVEMFLVGGMLTYIRGPVEGVAHE